MRGLVLILTLTILASIAAACGGSPTQTLTPAATTSPAPTFTPAPAASGSDPTEAGLRSRAESLAKAQSDGKWAEWYKFLSPDSKSGCSEADFSAAAAAGISSFREFKGLEESDQLEFRVQGVTVQGTQGQVLVDMYFDGELIFDSPNEIWVFADGIGWSLMWVADCGPPAPTPTLGPRGTSEGSFGEADMRALLSDEEVEAAIPLVIGDMRPITDLGGFAGVEGMVGKDSIWAHLFDSANAGGQLMVIVTDFVSPEILQQQIVVWTVRDSLEFTEPTIGDGSLQGQEGDTVSVRFWKGDKTVLLNATGLGSIEEVLDGLIKLAKLAESRLES